MDAGEDGGEQPVEFGRRSEVGDRGARAASVGWAAASKSGTTLGLLGMVPALAGLVAVAPLWSRSSGPAATLSDRR
ncbi:hypothetical protein AB0M47_28395 [Hamadaea sp. NPDC051192]|uniref:hypothetical protein n=1 Tax=Hamadaea sp. NPDC051192 TaxID=3154940 RepID=UPI00341FE595